MTLVFHVQIVIALPIGRDFCPDKPLDEWDNFRILSEKKNEAIDEIIAKLYFMKD